jgi:hypothetical protein
VQFVSAENLTCLHHILNFKDSGHVAFRRTPGVAGGTACAILGRLARFPVNRVPAREQDKQAQALFHWCFSFFNGLSTRLSLELAGILKRQGQLPK